VRKLKEEQDGNIVVHGSAQLVQALLDNDLVDELRLMVFPVVLGSGKRLFDNDGERKTLELVDATAFGSGVVSFVYRPSAAEGS
jgi:dihydrofolate reductase